MLTVEAKSPERAHEIASKLGQLGFKVVTDEDDANAGLLNLYTESGGGSSKDRGFRYHSAALDGPDCSVDLGLLFTGVDLRRYGAQQPNSILDSTVPWNPACGFVLERCRAYLGLES